MAIFDTNTYVDRTDAIEMIPFKPNLMSSLGLFREQTSNADTVTFDARENSIVVLNDSQRNTDQKNGIDGSEYTPHLLAIPHYPVQGTVTVKSLKNIRGFDNNVEQSIESAVAEKLESMADDHDNTLEYLQAKMLCSGMITTSSFGTINMFTEFNVTKKTGVIDSALALEPQVRAITNGAKKALLNGGKVRGYICLCGVDFFTAITNHSDVRTGFVVAGSDSPLRNELGDIATGYSMFTYGNVTFIQYDDVFTTSTGTDQPLADDAAVMLPRASLGSIFFGPVSKLSGVGTAGAKRFASSYRDPKDRYVEVESEQNTLVVLQEIGAVTYLTAIETTPLVGA